MEAWSLFLISLFFSICLSFLLFANKKQRLPPGPPAIPIFGNLLWFRNSIFNIEPILRGLHHQYGTIVTLCMGSRVAIFISDRAIAHKTPSSTVLCSLIVLHHFLPVASLAATNTTSTLLHTTFYGACSVAT